MKAKEDVRRGVGEGNVNGRLGLDGALKQAELWKLGWGREQLERRVRCGDQDLRLHVVLQRGLAGVEQHGQELVHVFVFWCQACANNVVAARHELHQLTPDVCMRQARREEYSVSALKAEDVEEKHRKNADVSAVLRVQVEDERRPRVPAATAASAGSKALHQRVHVCLHKALVGRHEGGVQLTDSCVSVVVGEAHAGQGGVMRQPVLLVATFDVSWHVHTFTLPIPDELSHECVAQRVADDAPQLGHVGGRCRAQEMVQVCKGPEAAHGKCG